MISTKLNAAIAAILSSGATMFLLFASLPGSVTVALAA